MLSAQKSLQLIENNNNQPLIDPIQKRRLSRSQENNLIDKNVLPLDNHTKSPSDAHYIKNKALQSPVNRYKVCTIQSIYTNFHYYNLFFNSLNPQELEEKTHQRSQLISSSLTHSNSELNSICPHKGSTKSNN